MSDFKKLTWLFIPLLFLLYSAPSALDYLFYFPDEKYYTDAVLQMMDKDDYFTPYSADGSPRFHKPIVTYWVLMGSYKLLGIGTFSSRIMFLLAGALLTAVVYLMTASLLKNKKTALLAALITAANPLVLMGAGRSIPDILLVLFLTISSWGFLKIMIDDHPRQRFFWMAYLGAALAFETKGLPAAAFAGLSFLYILLNPWRSKKLMQLLHPWAIISAIIVAFSWFVVMYIIHGTEYLNSFFADQVGYRVSSKSIQVVENTFLGIVNLLAFTLPWIIIAFSRAGKLKKDFIGSSAETRALVGFIGLWVITVIVMSGAVFRFYDRYLLPVIPLISLFFGMVIIQSETRFKQPALQIFLIVNLLVLIISSLYAFFIFRDFLLIAGTAVGISIFIFLVLFRNSVSFPGAILANSILLLWFNVHVLLFALLMPNQVEQLTETIRKEQVTGNEPVFVYGNIRVASGIRIYSGDQMNVISMDTLYMLPGNRKHLLVFNRREEHLLDLKDYRVIKGSEEWQRLPAGKFPGFLQPVVEKIKESGTVYCVAKPFEQQ
jgi:4-amino-4-deoxy-L-arabinose transferase-like glycosyltransferase